MFSGRRGNKITDKKLVSTEVDQSVGQIPMEVEETLIQPGSLSANGGNDDTSSRVRWGNSGPIFRNRMCRYT